MFVEYMYPVVSGGRIPFAGGIEVQLALMGQGLAQRGFDVRVVTCDYGQPDAFAHGGMTLHKAYPPSGGIPVVRFFHPRLTRGLSTLWRADADVYLFRGAALWAGLVHAVARARGRRFVWLTGHDHDVRRELPDVHGPRDRWFVRRAIRGADAIVTQSRAQQERLRADWGLESTVIMNSVGLPPGPELCDAGAGATALWLSTYKPEKRPEWFTRFAERHPAVPCRMVGVVPSNAAGATAFAAARAVAERCRNLAVSAAVPRSGLPEVFAGAAVFAHSSPAEGFPNTLLESWARAVPTVSCFDPDGIVERERLGAARADFETWAGELERRLANPALRREEGSRARAWAAAHHAPDLIHERLANLLRDVLAQPTGAAQPASAPRPRDDQRRRR
jgi:glycosyltransferase involved in cell wall biosynthesis